MFRLLATTTSCRNAPSRHLESFPSREGSPECDGRVLAWQNPLPNRLGPETFRTTRDLFLGSRQVFQASPRYAAHPCGESFRAPCAPLRARAQPRQFSPRLTLLVADSRAKMPRVSRQP